MFQHTTWLIHQVIFATLAGQQVSLFSAAQTPERMPALPLACSLAEIFSVTSARASRISFCTKSERSARRSVSGDIQTDCGNLHVDGSLMWFVATITLRRFVAGSGRRPPHHKLPLAPQQKAASFDDLVGAGE